MKADVVLGGGGYVAAPAGLAARSLRPAARADRGRQPPRDRQPPARSVRQAGLPGVRPARATRRRSGSSPAGPIPAGVADADRAAARARFGIDDERECLLVFGGSLGARRLNEAAIDAFGQRRAVLGPARLRPARLRRARAPARRARPARPLQAARLYHARSPTPMRPPTWRRRARAGSVFELLAAGLPAVLVPYPHATADHQTKNARWVERGGAAVVVPDDELDGPRLAREVAALLGCVRPAAHNAAGGARPRAAGRRGADRSRDSHAGAQVMGHDAFIRHRGSRVHLSSNWVPAYWGRRPRRTVGSPPHLHHASEAWKLPAVPPRPDRGVAVRARRVDHGRGHTVRPRRPSSTPRPAPGRRST